jgi:transposase-like protein
MRQFRRLPSTEKAHPLVRRLFAEMTYQQIGVLDMAERAGLGEHTLKHWRTRSTPKVDSLEACFNVLGMTLTPVRRKDDG